jgi:hypothetical protein
MAILICLWANFSQTYVFDLSCFFVLELQTHPNFAFIPLELA